MGKQKNIQTEEAQAKTGGKAGAVLGTLVNILLVLAIILAFFCTYTAYVTKKGSGVPDILGYEPFSIQTDSMSPFFEAGDLIIDKTIDDVSTLEVGDVITFWTIIEGERVLNTHRITEIVDADTYIYFVTKGDNNTLEDALTVHQSEVVGKYWTKISGLGSVLDFLQTSKGFFCIVVLPVAAFFIYYLVNFFKVLFEYQAAKNRLQFEEERVAKEGAAAVPLDGLDVTQEQLLQLLAKAQAAEKPAEATPEAKSAEATAEAEPEAKPAEGTAEAAPEAKPAEATTEAEAEHTSTAKAEEVQAEAETTEAAVHLEETPAEAQAEDTAQPEAAPAAAKTGPAAESEKISLSKEELEALIANAVKKAKEEE